MAEPNQKPAEKKPAEKKPGVFARLKKYFRDTKSEVKKVAWPTKQQTINNTGVVIACIVVVGAFIGVLDAVFAFGLQALLKLL
ncbi:MAG TPA: preprotein translocase subunit SecE [Candidatus Galloscillospira excrementipullorum]|nr:preprotein translocase subunit SecE [Candidatus Galloscillospira excrementipullorum]